MYLGDGSHSLAVVRPCTSTPVSLEDFTIMEAAGSVEISWRMFGPGVAEDFQLRGLSRGVARRIEPIESLGQQGFRAVDREVPTDSAIITYILFLRNADGSWGTLAEGEYRRAGLRRFVEIDAPFPSPSNSHSSIRITSTRVLHGEVTICDVRGRLVAQLFQGALQPGVTQLTWDGLDSEKRTAAAGVYFVRLHTDQDIKSRRIVRLD